MRVQIDTMAKGVDGKIDDIKERLTRIESVAVGRVETTTERRASATDARGLVGMIVGLAGIAVVVVDFLGRR
jgi:hypothetical protein